MSNEQTKEMINYKELYEQQLKENEELKKKYNELKEKDEYIEQRYIDQTSELSYWEEECCKLRGLEEYKFYGELNDKLYQMYSPSTPQIKDKIKEFVESLDNDTITIPIKDFERIRNPLDRLWDCNECEVCDWFSDGDEEKHKELEELITKYIRKPYPKENEETKNIEEEEEKVLCNWCGKRFSDDSEMIEKHLEEGLCEGILPETNELLKKGISWEESHKRTGNKQFPWINSKNFFKN